MSYYQPQSFYQPNFKPNNYQQYQPVQPNFASAPLMQQPYQAFQQDGTIPARLVSGREEAVASNVIPGSMFLFYDRANSMIYAKSIDSQTGIAEFRAFAEMPSQQPQDARTQPVQYATVEMLAQMQNEFEKRLEALQMPIVKKQGKAANEDG